MMKTETSTCQSRGHKIAKGGGCGDDIGFSYVYCLECEKFLDWDSFGMARDARKTTQHWVRARLCDAYKDERKNG